MTKKYPSQQQDKFVVRFPEGMRDRIAHAAKNSGRSMNAEIIHRLEQSFEPRVTADSEMAEMLALQRQILAEVRALSEDE